MVQEYEVVVPVLCRIKVKAVNPNKGGRMARQFVDECRPTQDFVDRYNHDQKFKNGVAIVEALISIDSDKQCEIVDVMGATHTEPALELGPEPDLEPDPEQDPEGWKDFHKMYPGGENDLGRLYGANGIVRTDWNEQARLSAVAEKAAGQAA